ncbi:MAG: hypothetical protein WC027_00995 [Candidatus Paceibacterota bacterium]
MKIDHKILPGNIHLLTFENQLDITSSFLRFQEYYESPKFKGQFFTLKEFREWYIKNSPRGKKTGKFTYYSDWSGFNIPSYVLKPFYENKFRNLSESEKNILNIFINEKEPFYIIGVHKKSKLSNQLLKHEIAHGLFATNKNYKKEILSVLSNYDTDLVKQEIRSKGSYHEDVLEDEIHAYCLATNSKLKVRIPDGLTKELRSVYKKYYK